MANEFLEPCSCAAHPCNHDFFKDIIAGVRAKAEQKAALKAEGIVDEYALTDLGNAERLVARHGDKLRYCHPWNRWLAWDGARWAVDETGEADRLAADTVRAIGASAAVEENEDRRKGLLKHAWVSESRPRLQAMVDLAKSRDGVAVMPDALDADPWLLNCANGTVDLRTGELRPHAQADLVTKLAPVEYDESATAPTWASFLSRIFDGDAELISFVKRAIGYSLTGLTNEQCMLVLYGSGANGKSTLLETLSKALGDYSLRTPTETLMQKRDGGVPNDVARLKGARFVTANEGEEGRRLDEGLIKAMTGGDTLTARFMRGEFFEFSPHFKLFFATNHKPVIRGTDRGIWRRIRLVPFEVSIPEAEQDKCLSDKLSAELPGILAWAIDGCLTWQLEGLKPPAKVVEATSGYRAEMDALGLFLAERCMERPGTEVKAKALYDEYKEWCEEAGERPASQRALGLKLRERGLQSVHRRGGDYWLGIGLSADQPAVMALPAFTPTGGAQIDEVPWVA